MSGLRNRRDNLLRQSNLRCRTWLQHPGRRRRNLSAGLRCDGTTLLLGGHVQRHPALRSSNQHLPDMWWRWPALLRQPGVQHRRGHVLGDRLRQHLPELRSCRPAMLPRQDLHGGGDWLSRWRCRRRRRHMPRVWWRRPGVLRGRRLWHRVLRIRQCLHRLRQHVPDPGRYLRDGFVWDLRRAEPTLLHQSHLHSGWHSLHRS